MTIHTIAKFLYGFFGAVFIIAGSLSILFSTTLLPEGIAIIIAKLADNNLNGVHLIQELGSLLVFAGLISFWFIRNYEQSMPFHWAMTVFWALLAFVHWFDIRGMRPSLMGPVINTIPVVLFVVVGVLRKKN